MKLEKIFGSLWARMLMLIPMFTLALTQTVFAMHIMEGFLPIMWCAVWAILCLPFILGGIIKISKIIRENAQMITILAMGGAFAFILSALKIPSVTGSSSHMTGLGFSAIMFGAPVASVLGLIVLLFQALLLAHGGLTTLGANTLSMGVVGPLVAFGIYFLMGKTKANKSISIFLAAALGDLATYIVTSFQLAIAFPAESGGFIASFTKFLGIFAVTQIPLAIVEGILTVVLLNIISVYAKDMLGQLGKGGLFHGK